MKIHNFLAVIFGLAAIGFVWRYESQQPYGLDLHPADINNGTSVVLTRYIMMAQDMNNLSDGSYNIVIGNAADASGSDYMLCLGDDACQNIHGDCLVDIESLSVDSVQMLNDSMSDQLLDQISDIIGKQQEHCGYDPLRVEAMNRITGLKVH